MLFRRSWLDKFCKYFKYLLTEFCDSLLSWPCVNLGRLSHQKTFNKKTFCLLDIAVDTFFSDSILPLVYSIRSPDDCIQYLMKIYELEVSFICFLFKKIIKKIYIINNWVFNFFIPQFSSVIRLINFLLPHPDISTTPQSVATSTVCGHAEACPSTTYAKNSALRGHYRGSS